MNKLLWLLVTFFAGSLLLHAEVLFYDNFDRPDGPVGNGWTNIGPATSSIENNTMKLISDNNKGIKREFTPVNSGTYYIQFEWKLTANDWLADAFPNDIPAHLLWDYEGDLYRDPDGSFASPTLLGNMPLNTWATIRWLVNLDTDCYSLWINDTLVADNILGNAVNSFFRFTFRSTAGSATTQYVDDFLIYNDAAPAIPANFTATGSVNEITLTWDPAPITDFLTYRVYRDTASPATTLLTEIPGSQNQYVDNSAAPNTDYYYRIKAVFMNTVESGYTNEVMAHLQPQIVVNPQTISLNVGEDLTDTTGITISNIGNYPLSYNLAGNINTIPMEGLVSYYPFDGDNNDYSGYGNTSVNYGATLTQDRFGRQNSAYNFNYNQYIRCTTNGFPTGNDDRTLMGWFKVDSFGSNEMDMFAYGTFSGDQIIGLRTLIPSTGTRPGVATVVQVVNAVTSLNTGIWYFLGFTLQNGIVRIYINGVLNNTGTIPINTQTNGNDFYLGANIFSGLRPYWGKIDDFYVYNRALNEAEIMTLYNSNTQLPISPFIAYPQNGILYNAQQQQVTIGYTKLDTIADPVTVVDTLYVNSNSFESQELPIVATVHIDTSPPYSVSSLAIDKVTTDANQIGITWSANAVADSVVAYKIYRRGRDDTNWTLKGTVPSNQLWFIDNQFTGLDSTYVWYRVRAEDWVGNLSAEGDSLQAALERYLAPANLSIELINNNRDARLSWDPVTHTISGTPGTPSCYIVYTCNHATPLSDYVYLGISFTTEFIHPYVYFFVPENRAFYIVTAYGGNLSRLDGLLAQKKEWTYGELEQSLLEQGTFNKE